MSPERRILHVPLIAAVLGAGSALPSRLVAQQALHKGEQVRVVSPPATPGQADSVATGSVVRLVNDTLVIDAGWTGLAHRLLAFDVEGDTRVEVLQGGHSHLWTFVGAIGGGLIVGALANAKYRHVRPDCCLNQSRYTLAGAIVGFAGGALIGVLIDSRHPGGHWVPVQTHGMQVAIGPAGVGLRLRL
jgi:hypothetical protein